MDYGGHIVHPQLLQQALQRQQTAAAMAAAAAAMSPQQQQLLALQQMLQQQQPQPQSYVAPQSSTDQLTSAAAMAYNATLAQQLAAIDASNAAAVQQRTFPTKGGRFTGRIQFVRRRGR